MSLSGAFVLVEWNACNSPISMSPLHASGSSAIAPSPSLNKPPASRISSYKRDFSASEDETQSYCSLSSQAFAPASSQSSADSASGPHLQPQSSAARERRLRAIQEAIAQREAGIAVGSKRPLPISGDELCAENGHARRRILPWEANAPSVRQTKNLTGQSDVPAATNPTQLKASGTVVLSGEQKHILMLVQEGKNVFFTGSAGKCSGTSTCSQF